MMAANLEKVDLPNDSDGGHFALEKLRSQIGIYDLPLFAAFYPGGSAYLIYSDGNLRAGD